MAQEAAIKTVIERSVTVIRMYKWLLDLYVLDFFVDNHWEKLPPLWRQCLDTDPTDLGKILSGQQTCHVVPLSLLALLKSVQSLSLSREPAEKDTAHSTGATRTDRSKLHPKLKNLFMKHVKLKKRHEIAVMAELVNKVSLESRCSSVLDFGSGVGHLVRVLAYQHSMRAVGIEAQAQLTAEARKLDLEFEYTAGKHLTKDQMGELHRPSHRNITLSSEKQLAELDLPESMSVYGLVGLHPCGDLGPLLLRHFVNCDRVAYICVVGCCYMKLSCSGDGCGYPMSDFLSELRGHELSYASREIACHAVEVYMDRLRRGDYHTLKVHAYRAALERLLVAADPALRHAPVRSVPRAHTLSFQRYCALAAPRVGATVAGAGMGAGEGEVTQWRRVVALYSLRLSLAPLVETVLLLDRTLYVLQQGFSCKIQPVFDPKVSPRNHIIVARRT